MISKTEIQHLLSDLESDRVERTISTDNMDKFGEAICSFANDLPDYQQPGYLIIGADDKTGKVVPVNITDKLLQKIASIRTEGNIQPQPSMIVQKVNLDDGPVLVAEVQPAHFPPVRYKGKVCVRVGPRKGVANEDDQRKLYEKRASHVLTFDALPCLGATLDDLDVRLFRQIYLHKAYPEEIIENDKRDIRLQMQSLGFYDMTYNCPTYAGILMFGNNVERRLPGAYVQYVRFGGNGRGADITFDYKFAGNLMTILNQLDTFVSTTIAKKRPVPVSALREENVVEYPAWAIRELLMNAVCHRDYESNGPIQFYQYDNRLEILNPGALYGKANSKNFPWINDYRNSVIAEAMKVLGFVNRFSRGIQRVQDDLISNENGPAVFRLDLDNAFLVTVNVSQNPITQEKGINEPLNEPKDKYEPLNDTLNETLDENEPLNEPLNEPKDEYKPLNEPKDKYEPLNEPLISSVAYSIYSVILHDNSITRENMAASTGLSLSSTRRAIAELKAKGIIERIGGKKYGRWQILKHLQER